MTVLTACSVSSHFKGLGTHSSSSTRMSDQHPLRELQDGHGLLPSHAREVIQEGVEGLSTFEIVQQSLHRHTRSHEDGGAPQDVRIRVDDLLRLHGPPPLISRILYPVPRPLAHFAVTIHPVWSYPKNPTSSRFTRSASSCWIQWLASAKNSRRPWSQRSMLG